jgi:hypothetical protein
MFSPMNLFVGIITGAVGTGYFIYGKKQGKFVFWIDGILLCIYPYFLSNLYGMMAIGLVLIVIPFFIREN